MEKPLLLKKPERLALVAGAGQFRMVVKPQPEYEQPPQEYAHYSEDEYWGWSWRNLKKGDWFSGVTKKMLMSDKGLLYPNRPRFQVNDLLWCKEPYEITGYSDSKLWLKWTYLDDRKKTTFQKITTADWEKWGNRERLFNNSQAAWMYKSLARYWFKVKSVKCEQEEGVWYFVYEIERIEK